MQIDVRQIPIDVVQKVAGIIDGDLFNGPSDITIEENLNVFFEWQLRNVCGRRIVVKRSFYFDGQIRVVVSSWVSKKKNLFLKKQILNI